jgi:hypothetical protein
MNPVTNEELSAYLDNALSESDRARVDRALAESPDLRIELARLRALGQLIKSVPAQEPPADFYARVMNKTRVRPRRWAPWGVSLVTAMAATLVMVFVFKEKPPLNRAMPATMANKTMVLSEREDSLKDMSQETKKQFTQYKPGFAGKPIVPAPKRVSMGDEKLKLVLSPHAMEGATPSSASEISAGSSGLVGLSKADKTADREFRKKIISPSTVATKESDLSSGTHDWRGDSSGITDERQIVIRSKKEWETLWAQHQSIQYPPQPVPIVDFEKQMVVGIFSGDKGSSGYETTILDVAFDAAEVRVFYHLSTPERQPGMGFLAVMTQPHHLKSVPRSDLPVRFVEK